TSASDRVRAARQTVVGLFSVWAQRDSSDFPWAWYSHSRRARNTANHSSARPPPDLSTEALSSSSKASSAQQLAHYLNPCSDFEVADTHPPLTQLPSAADYHHSGNSQHRRESSWSLILRAFFFRFVSAAFQPFRVAAWGRLVAGPLVEKSNGSLFESENKVWGGQR
ncbi:hypothetical protein DH86_00003618, partial [Scytalidium sp. 3C]